MDAFLEEHALLLAKYDKWSRRDLTGKQYVSIWAAGIHVRIRLADPANPKQCLLVVMGATADGQKELIAVIDGVRESKQSWLELLLDLKNRGSPFHRRSLSPMVRSASGPPCGRPTRRRVGNAAQVHKTANVINSRSSSKAESSPPESCRTPPDSRLTNTTFDESSAAVSGPSLTAGWPDGRRWGPQPL